MRSLGNVQHIYVIPHFRAAASPLLGKVWSTPRMGLLAE
jgi:hypothetical protein